MMPHCRPYTLMIAVVFCVVTIAGFGKDKDAAAAAKKPTKVRSKSKKKRLGKTGADDKKAENKGDKKTASEKKGDEKPDKAIVEGGAPTDKNPAPEAATTEATKAEAVEGALAAEGPAPAGPPAEGGVVAGGGEVVPAGGGDAAVPGASPEPGAPPVEAAAPAAGDAAPVAANADNAAPDPAAKPVEVPASAPTAADVPPAPGVADAEPPTAGVLPSAAPTLPPPVAAPPVKRPDPPLDVTGYVSAADLERVLGKKHKFRRVDLPGVKPSKGYNSLYYKSKKAGVFGVSVQIWRDQSLVDSRTRFNAMRNTYNDVVPTDKVAEQGFRAHFAKVVTLVFADARKPVVVSVSCSVVLCSPDAIIELSRRVSDRIR